MPWQHLHLIYIVGGLPMISWNGGEDDIVIPLIQFVGCSY